MAHNFCCAHPQQRIDSPEPPSRPPLKIDSLLAAAALPEDHPHALRFPDKKPDLDSSIVRSPNIADKLKWQFRRKSTKGLRSTEVYDLDAHPITSTEVLDTVRAISGEQTEVETHQVHTHEHPVSLRTLSTPVTLEDCEPRNDVLDSVLKSLGWLRPLLERPSDLVIAEPEDHFGVATTVAVQQDITEASATARLTVQTVPQSLSSPNLLYGQRQPVLPLRRTQSFLGLATALKLSKLRAKQVSLGTGSPDTLRESLVDTPKLADRAQPGGTRSPELDVEKRVTYNEQAALDTHEYGRKISTDASVDYAPEQSNATRLHTMDISNQLRSMSALSDPSEEDASLLSANQPWNFHHRERSAISGFSVRSRHSRPHSNIVGDGAVQSDALSRVMSPAASSIYSSPSSILESCPIDNDLAGRVLQSYEIPCGLDGTHTDWPLPMPADRPAGQLSSPAIACAEQQVSAPLCSAAYGDSGSTSFVTADGDEDASVRWASTPRREASVPSKDSSSHLTVSSMRSKFRERLSTTRKIVRKRRSMFKFLRPGSRKAQGRSISSPMLSTEASHPSGTYDGPSDDPGLLMVEYEMADSPQHTTRSASVSHFDQRRGTATHLAVPTSLPQRRPSLADYERSLTATGDDRRRPSSLNVQKLQEVHEDDRRQSILLRRKISRAKPLNDDHVGLMAQALERNQEEKALFRSPSKQREASGGSHPANLQYFRRETMAPGRVSLPPLTPEAHNDLLDPLERPRIKISAGRSHSTGHLLSPGHPDSVSLLQKPTAANPPYASSTPSVTTLSSQTSNAQEDIARRSLATTKRIGTSLSSWTRFPSHTRAERCGPAGLSDAIVTRDFAVTAESGNPSGPTDLEAASPTSKKSGKASKMQVVKRRSTTFGGLVRYYSNIFSSVTSPQNRRSSIATGGWLTNPDLELLPPATSNEPTFPHHDHHFKERLHQLEHDLEERMRKDVEYVEEGAVKLEAHILKDVEQVEEEAERFMHVGPHHHHEAPRGSSPFHEGSPFALCADLARLKRDSTLVDPMDGKEDGIPTPVIRVSEVASQTTGHTERNITLDGTSDVNSHTSKAQAWSSIYQECLIPSSSSSRSGESTIADESRLDDVTAHSASNASETPGAHAMDPPLLKPTKARSAQQAKGLDPNATVRRFPSVTVVDDQKGHGRSISLISIKLGADNVMRSSTNDLLQLIQAREQEEREKLLRGITYGET